MTQESEKPSEDTWPSVESAQMFIVPSYQWMITRVESADSRLQTLVAFVATITFAVPVLGAALSKGISLRSPWFLCALLVAVGIVVCGTVARSRGSLNLADPKKVYDRTLHLTKWEFQRDAIYFAGEHFNDNRTLIETKALMLTLMTGFFVLELILLAIWIATYRASWGVAV